MWNEWVYLLVTLAFPVAVAIYFCVQIEKDIKMIAYPARTTSSNTSNGTYAAYTSGTWSDREWWNIPVLSDPVLVQPVVSEVDVLTCEYCGTPQRTKNKNVLLCDACGAPLA